MANSARRVFHGSLDRHPPVRTILDALNFRLTRIVAINQRLGTRTTRQNFDLSLTEWRVLGVASALERASFQAIRDTLFMDKAQISRALKVLSSRGLITTSPCPEDGRQLLVSLTASGRVLHDKALAVSLQRNEADLSDLTPAEVEIFFDLLDRIARSVERQLADDAEQDIEDPSE
ncbi:MAG: MarR family transcriptional regulator [Rhodobacteraceae bacterium]|nr:MarR family transcriptional regulator [Paracoccaceae bacterium]